MLHHARGLRTPPSAIATNRSLLTSTTGAPCAFVGRPGPAHLNVVYALRLIDIVAGKPFKPFRPDTMQARLWRNH